MANIRFSSISENSYGLENVIRASFDIVVKKWVRIHFGVSCSFKFHIVWDNNAGI